MFFVLILAMRTLAVASSPDAEYQIFPGFGFEELLQEMDTVMTKRTTIDYYHHPTTTTTTIRPKRHRVYRVSSSTTTPHFTGLSSLTGANDLLEPDNGTTPKAIQSLNNKTSFICPENEQPSNIGPYEVPSQRDLVLLTIKTLHRMFGSYHQKAMMFLEDMGKVVQATQQVEKKCAGNKLTYRRCVKHVSAKCETITKSLTVSLEQQRQDVLAFGHMANTICSIEAMKEDPVKLIKILASEEASLEFALPGFLRLMDACAAYCISPVSVNKFKAVKPARHLTDTDIVIRHFLTKKNYKRLLHPDTRRSAFKIPAAIGNKRKP